ncbi:MAG: protease modulator HflC [Planctomycetes bacterium]|jgi:membrane protease subunit HflC|nr:protease modulator HflC [Planctomycetota bacterium]
MRNFWVFLSVALVVVVLTLFAVVFQVRETETVIVTRFGKPVRPITEPGLYLKYPLPIDRVHRFDSRCRLFEGVLEETNTAGNQPIIVNSYIVWRIADPKRYLVAVQDMRSAEGKLRSLLRNAQNSVIGRHSFSDFVNTDPQQIKVEQIESEIQSQIAEHALTQYGIEVSAVGIKRLMITESVTEKVFDRMRADRKGRTESILAAGNAEAQAIRSEADAMRQELLAVAESQAKAIRGAGDAEAAAYYQMLEADPELAMFLRDIEALRKILKERSTIVLGVETEPIHLLKELPKLQPKQTEN